MSMVKFRSHTNRASSKSSIGWRRSATGRAAGHAAVHTAATLALAFTLALTATPLALALAHPQAGDDDASITMAAKLADSRRSLPEPLRHGIIVGFRGCIAHHKRAGERRV